MEPLKVIQMFKVLYGTIKGSSDVEGSFLEPLKVFQMLKFFMKPLKVLQML